MPDIGQQDEVASQVEEHVKELEQTLQQREQEQVPPAVIVSLTYRPDGSMVPQLAVQGGVDPLSVATVLELAIVRWRAELGLS